MISERLKAEARRIVLEGSILTRRRRALEPIE
jgi:hypothetical protein